MSKFYGMMKPILNILKGKALEVLSEDSEIIDDSCLSECKSFEKISTPQPAQAGNIYGINDGAVTYNKQPTLLIGLGGSGSKIVGNIYRQTKNYANLVSFAVDYYQYDTSSDVAKYNFISIAQESRLPNILNNISNVAEWFPESNLLRNRGLNYGAAPVRVLARLHFELALRQKKFDALFDTVDKLAKECINKQCPLRVSIVTSLVGGTGSGIFIQTALLVRDYINKNFPSLNVKIHGEFIMPSNFAFSYCSNIAMRHMEANTYAALKELNAINECFFDNALPLKLNYKYDNAAEETTVDNLPFDYCFLYEKISKDNVIDSTYIENAIIERLFSPSANALYDAFINILRSDVRKNSGNLYGIISTENIPNDAAISDSAVFSTISTSGATLNGRQILMITSDKKMEDFYKQQLPDGTILLENIMISAPATTVTEFTFGIEISKFEKIKHDSGQYYLSYKQLISQIPQSITPHLNKKWHEDLSDIGESIAEERVSDTKAFSKYKIPEGSFVFISYSSKEIETANQIKHVIETNGIPCWMAPQSIPAGSDYGVEIPKAIEKCNALLLLLSDASQKSNWVPKEVGLAIGKGKVIIPFQIDNAAIVDAFNFYLTNSQRISAYNRMTEAYMELLTRLKDILN